MKSQVCVMTAIAVCLMAGPTASAQETEAADVAGVWEMTNETLRGTFTSTFTFEQDGNTLTGTVEGRMASAPIHSGSVEGNEVTFKVVRGRGSRGFEMTYTGVVDGDTITGSMSTRRGEREFTMRRVEG